MFTARYGLGLYISLWWTWYSKAVPWFKRSVARPLTSCFWVWSQSSPSEICVQSGTGTGLFSDYICFSRQHHSTIAPFHQRSTLIFIYMLLLPEGQAGEAWEHSKKRYSSVKRGMLDRLHLFTFYKTSLYMLINDARMHPSHTHTHTHTMKHPLRTYNTHFVYKTNFTSVPTQTNKLTDELTLTHSYLNNASQCPNNTAAAVRLPLSMPDTVVLPSASLAHNTRILNKTRTSCTPLIVVAASWIPNIIHRCIMNCLNNC